MPDMFRGEPAAQEWYPPDTDEKKAKLGPWFENKANPGEAAAKVPKIVEEIARKTGGTIGKWGVVGMCWGGKVRWSLRRRYSR